jgi:hypothetical protein
MLQKEILLLQCLRGVHVSTRPLRSTSNMATHHTVSDQIPPLFAAPSTASDPQERAARLARALRAHRHTVISPPAVTVVGATKTHPKLMETLLTPILAQEMTLEHMVQSLVKVQHALEASGLFSAAAVDVGRDGAVQIQVQEARPTRLRVETFMDSRGERGVSFEAAAVSALGRGEKVAVEGTLGQQASNSIKASVVLNKDLDGGLGLGLGSGLGSLGPLGVSVGKTHVNRTVEASHCQDDITFAFTLDPAQQTFSATDFYASSAVPVSSKSAFSATHAIAAEVGMRTLGQLTPAASVAVRQEVGSFVRGSVSHTMHMRGILGHESSPAGHMEMKVNNALEARADNRTVTSSHRVSLLGRIPLLRSLPALGYFEATAHAACLLPVGAGKRDEFVSFLHGNNAAWASISNRLTPGVVRMRGFKNDSLGPVAARLDGAAGVDALGGTVLSAVGASYTLPVPGPISKSLGLQMHVWAQAANVTSWEALLNRTTSSNGGVWDRIVKGHRAVWGAGVVIPTPVGQLEVNYIVPSGDWQVSVGINVL